MSYFVILKYCEMPSTLSLSGKFVELVKTVAKNQLPPRFYDFVLFCWNLEPMH